VVLEIQTGEKNPVLRKISTSVEKFDKGLKNFCADLLETMLKKDGVGLAAPQVGRNERVIAIRLLGKRSEQDVRELVMVNPEILERSLKTAVDEEGCLSLPGILLKIERAEEIKVRFCSPKGEELVLVYTDLPARIIQHEVDHLEGILICDY